MPSPIKWVSELVSGIIKPATEIIDELNTSEEEKLEAKRRLEELLSQHQARVMAHAEVMTQAQRDVLVAELQQDDAYTKRARPTVVYAGLALLALNHMVLPWAAHFTGNVVPAISFPAEFWLGWSGIVATWAIGRTAEKRAQIQNKIPPAVVRSITGSL